MLNLASEEFGVICPESIFVVEKKILLLKRSQARLKEKFLIFNLDQITEQPYFMKNFNNQTDSVCHK